MSRGSSQPLDPRVVESLRGIVGRGHVLVEPDVTASYGIDWTGRFRGAPAAVVRPGDSAEVAAVLDQCRAAGIALVPQGGNTGLVGGGVPLAGEIVLSVRRLSWVADVDEKVRVSGKDKDDLQAVMQLLRAAQDIKVPLQFNNYR